MMTLSYMYCNIIVVIAVAQLYDQTICEKVLILLYLIKKDGNYELNNKSIFT